MLITAVVFVGCGRASQIQSVLTPSSTPRPTALHKTISPTVVLVEIPLADRIAYEFYEVPLPNEDIGMFVTVYIDMRELKQCMGLRFEESLDEYSRIFDSSFEVVWNEKNIWTSPSITAGREPSGPLHDADYLIFDAFQADLTEAEELALSLLEGICMSQ